MPERLRGLRCGCESWLWRRDDAGLGDSARGDVFATDNEVDVAGLDLSDDDLEAEMMHLRELLVAPS